MQRMQNNLANLHNLGDCQKGGAMKSQSHKLSWLQRLINRLIVGPIVKIIAQYNEEILNTMSELSDAQAAQSVALSSFITDVDAALQKILDLIAAGTDVTAEVQALKDETAQIVAEDMKVKGAVNPPATV